MSHEFLERRCWQIERDGGDVVAPHIIFHPGGRLGGFRTQLEWSWSTRGQYLLINDWFGRPFIIFNETGMLSDGKARLVGRCRDEHDRRFLVEIDPISTISPHDHGIEVEGGPSPIGRRNLVIVRAGESSLHPQWRKNIHDGERTWDLCVSWFGKHDNLGTDARGEFQVFQDQDRKYSAMYKLFHRDSQFWNYDFIMLPDDDLMMSWLDINTLFEITREHMLELAQPALSRDSYYGPSETLKQDNSLMRFTNYVEGMCPIFSSRALKICVPTFRRSFSGYGLDLIWSTLLGGRPTSMAIIDLVDVKHTRPVGSNYGGYDAGAEARALAELYSVKFRYIEYGRLLLAG